MIATSPKNFGPSDVYNNIITCSRDDLIYDPLTWQEDGLQQTASGYGRKLTTHWKIEYMGRKYRVYCTCISNAGSCWFVARGHRIGVSAH